MLTTVFKCLLLALVPWPGAGDYTVTIHPEYLAQGGRTHFEADRWNGHNGLDGSAYISKNKAIGTESGRWLNSDLNGDRFRNAPEDPHRKGYADPKYFNNPKFEEAAAGTFLNNLKGYGFDLDMVMELKGSYWPHWMNTSLHRGNFPNNLDAGAEMVLLLLEAVSRHTGGHIPPYFEVINEPGTLWQSVDWDTMVNYHRIVAGKLKKKFPKLKVGGPTNTGYIANSDYHDFSLWKRLQQFMDMSLDHMDFFSFHAYNRFHKEGNSYEWSGINEARLVAVIDLIESYAWHKKGRSVPLMVSEFGLGGDNVKTHTQSNFNEWAFAFAHNAQMFTYQNFRGDMDRAIAFLLSKSQNFAGASLFRQDHSYTHTAKAFQFWHHFNYNQQFLRVDSVFDGKERQVSPLALADPHSQTVYVLLHNYQQSATHVKINFDKQWTHATLAKSTCFYFNSHQTPVLVNDQTITLTNNMFTLPAEASCYVTIKSGHNFASIPTLQEHTYYSNEMVIPVKGHDVDTTVTIPSLGHVHYARLRVAVSAVHRTAHTKPKNVHVNGHTLTSSYTLYAPGKQYADTLWDVYVYNVPGNILKQHSNAVRLEFNQFVGHVSSVALVTAITSGGTGIVG
ncbi:beta-porphyranase A-like [Liolophura sinensis]|uniref:beta-porphyranase A-like n=1 Tax=Liolophura sinensis TaxID=3198878 RepID=UPI00315948E8